MNIYSKSEQHKAVYCNSLERIAIDYDSSDEDDVGHDLISGLLFKIRDNYNCKQ